MEDLKNTNPERWKALHKLSRCNGFGYMDRETKEFIYTNNIYFEVIEGFSEYISRITTENIEMVHSMDGNPVFSSTVHLPYKTRFTSVIRQEENKQAYWATWDYANRRHLKGVFLTLTAPSHAGDLVTVNNQMREAWDKLRDLLNSKLARGLTYIKVNEFQKNGRLHFHLVIFGINWVMPIHLLKKVWVSYGGGKVMNICAITRTKEGWTWARKPPKEAGVQAPAGFLSDYLEKSMSPRSGALYWAFNIQFWSASRDIKQSPEKHETKGFWARVSVVSKKGKRLFQKNNDKAKAFFAGALLQTRKESDSKSRNKPKEKEKPLASFRRACELIYNP
ncbi:MAG TPA: replication endonuclease [Methanosarcina sp.]|nr:replication endonuclease [Methanosarcina sp.]